VFTVRTSGSVYLFGPELDILDTVEFQRLAGIKQLGTSYFVFRGAVHSRFEHALGVVHTAQRIIDIVNGNRYTREIGERETRLARLFALLHDLPHVTFGHTLEDEFGLLTRHDSNAKRIERLLWNSRIGEILEEALEPEEMETLRRMIAVRNDQEIAALGEDAFVVDIVANTVCADAIDYVQRDLEACGMPVELGERFLEYFIVTDDEQPNPVHRNRMALVLEKQRMPRPDVESEVVKLLTYRYELAERVYFHHAKNAASSMIARGVEALGLHKRDENFDRLSDDLLLALLREPDLAEVLGVKLASDGVARALAVELGEAIAARSLYKIAYLGVADDFGARKQDVWHTWGGPDGRRALEDRIADLAGLPSGRVLVHLPPLTMAEKRADVRVVTTDGAVVTLDEWDRDHNGRVAALNQAHRRIWRVAVYAHPELSEDDSRLVQLAAREALFNVAPRYVEEAEGTYLQAVFEQLAPDEGYALLDRGALVGKARGEQPYASLGEAQELVRGLVAGARAATAEQAF
jgi:HD superfamily phosphohydrolase